MREIVIGERKIGLSHPPFIIAEMSGNHNQSLEKALKIVDTASKAGVHALKLQTYTADTITIDINNENFVINAPGSSWNEQTLYEFYQKAYTPWEWHKPIFDRCHELGMIAFSSPFDESAVDFLNDLNVPAYKIASCEVVHLPLLKKVALTGKPVIMSTGMASIAELDDAISTLRNFGCNNIILLKCTTNYPSSPKNANLLTIPHLRNLFETEVGLSDHSMGIGVGIASIALGATVIEKHFTLSRTDGAIDSAFSMEPQELKTLVIESKQAWDALGKVYYGATNAEQNSIRFRRSLYISKDMRPGDIFTAKNLRIIRPGGGLHPKYYDLVLGKHIKCAANKGTPVSWELIN